MEGETILFFFIQIHLNFPSGKFGVFMQISKFYLGHKLVQEIFKNKNIPIFSHPKFDLPFSTFFSSKIQYAFGTNFFSSTIQSAF